MEGGKAGEFIYLQVSAHGAVVVDLWPSPIIDTASPFSNTPKYTTHWPVSTQYRVSRPCLVGCKAARDLLVQALTQTAGNLWPPARNLRGSELVLDRGIRMAAHYGCWGTRIWIVGCPYWGSFDMLKCRLPCSTDTDIYLASGLRRAESRTAGGNDTGLGNRAVMTRETVVAATGYYTEDGPERIGPE